MASYGNGYDASFSYSGGYQPNGYTPAGPATSTNNSTLRRRLAEDEPMSTVRQAPTRPGKKAMVKKLDFMFPKIEAEYTVRTDKGGFVSLIAYGLIAVLVLAEVVSWRVQQFGTSEHISVDTSLGKRMRVNLDITFPSLACEDLHVDIMDVAGDSQLDVEETMIKKRLNRRGLPMGREETVEANQHKAKQEEKKQILNKELPDDYCGPCYGAHETEDQCCNTCDELLAAYQLKRWRVDLVKLTAEQCIREGKDKSDLKPLKKGEGCNLSGYFMVNRVGGNFHIAMGEGIERDGRHIHTFNPEEAQNFNASHIINHLTFGPEMPEFDQNGGHTALNGATKIVQKEHGTTGLFQYFIKVVPTTYVGVGPGATNVETNRFFFTERFRPLMTEYFADDDDEVESLVLPDEEDESKVAVHAGHAKHHGHHDHHNVQKNSILPGVFFIYEIYPFEVQVTPSSVPFTHLLIRLMATIGGVFTIVRWADSFLHSRERPRGGGLGFV